jgi:lambda family phage portal protein
MTQQPAGRSLLNRISFGLLGRSQRAAASTALRGFDGARVDRLTADWLATGQSINSELRGDLDRLRSRGRELVNNNDYARKFVGMCQNNIIGPGGIRLQARSVDIPMGKSAKAQPDRVANAAIEAAWDEFQTVADVAGQQHLRDMCETMVGGLPADGEFLVRMVRGSEAGNRFNFALQIIDVDRIDTTFNGRAANSGNTVIMGVEVNAYRRPVALHLFTAHPNDGTSTGRMRERVPMEDLVHGFKVERAGQVRGIPWMAPGMLSLHHLGGFMLSAVLAAENNANHFGFFTQTVDAFQGRKDNDLLGAAETKDGVAVSASQPGIYDTLPVGVEFQPHESKYPSETFGPFVKTALQRIATGWRVAYVSLANDLMGVSYSSIRSGVLEERDRWSADQEWFIQVLLERVFPAWLQMALLSGAITMPNGSALPVAKLQKFSRHQWQPRRWEWVDPKGDMEAKILMVKAGLMSPQDLAAAQGYDFEDVVEAISEAKKIAADFGVQLTAYDAAPGANAPAQPDPMPQPTPGA